jgi:hypothetical protein
MSSGRPVIVASSHRLASEYGLACECDGGDQRGRRESHLDHFVSPNGERTQMFVSLLESGVPCETFHHAPSTKREHLRSHVVMAAARLREDASGAKSRGATMIGYDLASHSISAGSS